MGKFYKIAVIILTIILASISVILTYLYLKPVFGVFPKISRMNIATLDQARNYYTILSSTVSLIVGTLGLVLGYFYYLSKYKNDCLAESIERKRKRLNDLIECINQFDEIVDNIIHYRFSSISDLKHLRNRISRKFEVVEIMLQLNKDLLGLQDEEVKTILRVNSFVEQNDIIMHINYEQINETVLFTVKDRYIDLIQEARRICYKNVC